MSTAIFRSLPRCRAREDDEEAALTALPTREAPADAAATALMTVDTVTVSGGEEIVAGALAPGTRVGCYVIAEQLGKGGSGLVYAALDPELGRRMFLAMELVEGGTLRHWLSARHSGAEALALLIQAGRGLSAAHAAGLIHRDFKPDNVLIGLDGRVRVTDFGLVRALDGPERAPELPAAPQPAITPSMLATPLTRAASLMGTPGYMAPEQYAATATDARTDQFSFCVTLYEALWGVRPFAGASMDELREATAGGQLVEPPGSPRRAPHRRRDARADLALPSFPDAIWKICDRRVDCRRFFFTVSTSRERRAELRARVARGLTCA